uniref:adenylate/guanylate cyclase domain-containing protein n=1 Tax=Fulvivirga sp. TaxID=1931237 RepID=UPI00404A89AD
MKFKNKRNWQIIKQFSIGWSLAFMFISFVRGEGTEELGSVQFELLDALFVSLFIGSILGSISGFAQVLTEEYGYKQISLQKLLLFRVIFVVLFVIFMILLAYAVYGKNITLLEFAFEPGSFAIYFYIVFVDFFMVALRQINLFFGSNNLWKILTGKYYTPREEERVFMFLDLQSSTKHAERLGHISYSKMIQDCFNDLGVVTENDTEIYQYVGDEVILTWKLNDGLKNQNCINAYYHFQKQLIKKKEYYLQKYNCQPHFKAGVNEGLVTVTEIGKYKKEIAYHGDPINTAARIQGKCNELQRELLISENLKTKLAETDFTFEELGKIELRGKEKQVSLYAVHKKA